MAYASEIISTEEWSAIKAESHLLKDVDGPIESRVIDRESGRWIVEVSNHKWREEMSRVCVFFSGTASVRLEVDDDLAGHLAVSVRERIGFSATEFRELSGEVFAAVAALYKRDRERVVFAPPVSTNIGWRFQP